MNNLGRRYYIIYTGSGFPRVAGFPRVQLSLLVACCLPLGGGAVLGGWFVLTMGVSQGRCFAFLLCASGVGVAGPG